MTRCPVCSGAVNMTAHHIYGRRQSKLTMPLCLACHVGYNREAARAKPGYFTRAVFQYVIDHMIPEATEEPLF